jgi:hypothetical protein
LSRRHLGRVSFDLECSWLLFHALSRLRGVTQYSLGPFDHVFSASFLDHIAIGSLGLPPWNRSLPFEKLDLGDEYQPAAAH